MSRSRDTHRDAHVTDDRRGAVDLRGAMPILYSPDLYDCKRLLKDEYWKEAGRSI